MFAQRRTAFLFVLNGLAATAVQYASLRAFVELLHVPSVGLANGLASLFGISASYLGNRFVVFQSPTATTTRSLPRFVALYAALAGFNAAALWLWSDVAGLAYTPGFVVATALATLMSYLGNRYFVFPASGAGVAHA